MLVFPACFRSFCFFFFTDTAPTDIYTYLHTLSLHDALPISFLAYGGVDALNPERTEAALLYLAIAIGVLASLFDCLPRDADGVLAAAIIALRLIQDILVLGAGGNTPFDACHVSLPSLSYFRP